MRIGLCVLSLMVLGACSSSGDASASAHANRETLERAQLYCMDKGYSPGTFDYKVCYENRPEIQAYERRSRLNGLQIINVNRSPRMDGKMSRPVE